jgi:beta-galactosidase
MTDNHVVVPRLRILVFPFAAALAVLAPAVFGQTYSPPPSPREDISLDAGWRFIRQDVAGAQTNGFDDSSWTLLNLPHTWNNLDGQNGGNDYYRGIGWYRRHYTVDASSTNREFFLKFDGANIVADVYVNGTFIGEHQGGFAAFTFDVTPSLNVGADNVIAVKVNNAFNTNIPPLNADFTFFGGIYRDVHLLATDPLQVSPLDYGSPGVYLKTTSVSSNSANLQVTTIVSNANPIAATVTVRAIVTDAATNIVTTLTNIVTLSASSVSNVVGSTVISNPHLWNGLYDPYLYQTFIEIYNGTNLTDLVGQPLGFRYFSVDLTNGFFLNGVHYDLHGVNMHQDWLNYGWALTNGQRDANFALLKEIGATFLRESHYEHSDYEYQLADQAGLCVWSEVPVIDYITASAAFYTNTLQQLREMIRQRYNHPSVICWSIYNEITLQSGPSPITLINLETQLVGQEDPTRFLTEAANTSDNDPTTTNTQLIAFNKYYGWYNGAATDFGPWADNFHTTYPTRKMGITEYGAGASVWQHSEDPVTEPANAGPYHPEEYQNLLHESTWAQMKARPFLWCKLVWNGFDFAADGRSEGDTPGRNDKGLVTFDRQIRKDAFYFYKASWTTNAMVYIAGHTFSNRIANITAKAYSNCGSVQLFVNGVSQGTAMSSSNTFLWPVTLQNGTNNVSAIGTLGSTTVTDSLMWIVAPAPPPPAGLLSQGQPVTAYSFQAGNGPSNGNDGNFTTRWAASDGTFPPQWWRVDLGSVQPLTNAVITWYNGNTRAYQYKIQTNNDDVAADYADLVNNTTNTAFGNTTNVLSGSARYVRVSVTGCNNCGGFASFYECQIYGGTPPPPSAPTSLVATAGDTVVNLTWVQSATPGITTNKVYRSTTGSGGPYGLLASLAATTSYADMAVVNGTNYFYTVTAVSSNGESTMSGSAGATPLSAFQSWQLRYFGCTNSGSLCAQAAPDADPYGKGTSNYNQFLLGLNPTNPSSIFQILSVVPQTNDIVITWTAGGGCTNVVQAASGDVSGNYATNFADISGPIAIPGSGDTTTNYLDSGAVTNGPDRYYRIRLGP